MDAYPLIAKSTFNMFIRASINTVIILYTRELYVYSIQNFRFVKRK